VEYAIIWNHKLLKAEADTVITYIDNQHEHHRKRTFQQEYRAFLKKYEVEYDERYVWD
jgi:hypothetical protein